METNILLDVREDSFEGVGGVGNIEVWVSQVGEEIRKVSPHAVVGAPQSAMGVVPPSCSFIDCSLFEEHSPLVVPEFQPMCELCFADLRKKPHQQLQVLSCIELRSPRHVPCDDGCLMEVTHLHRHGESLQHATSAIADDRPHLPSDSLQSLNAVLVRTDSFVGEKFPEEILLTVGTPPHHYAEEPLKVGGVHDNDHVVGCQRSLLNIDTFQLSLHPLRAASVLLCKLCVGLFAVGELFPNLSLVTVLLLTELFPAIFTPPQLSGVVCAVLLDGTGSAMRTYFS